MPTKIILSSRVRGPLDAQLHRLCKGRTHSRQRRYRHVARMYRAALISGCRVQVVCYAPSPRSFPLGHIVATPGVLEAIGAERALALVSRHAHLDWGDVPPEDAQSNQDALEHGGRLLSAYTVGRTQVWIITEADRATTTVLLPEEY